MHKINEEVKVTYVALDFKTGLVDLKLTPIKPDGTPEADVILVELASAPGVYQGAFIPVIVGAWVLKISCASTNDKGSKQIKVISHNIESVHDQNVSILSSLDDIKGVGFNSASHSLKVISEEIAPGGYIA